MGAFHFLFLIYLLFEIFLKGAVFFRVSFYFLHCLFDLASWAQQVRDLYFHPRNFEKM